MSHNALPTLVSCIMPTADRRAFVGRAVEYFLRQDYGAKELIVVDDGEDAVGDLMPADARVRYVRVSGKLTVGAKRNLACEQARGEFIAHWDDDDWHAPRRLSYQVGELSESGAEVCGIRELLFYEPGAGRAWRYVYPAGQRLWLSGSSLCYRRAFWAANRFADISIGEDARFVWGGRPERMRVLADQSFHVGMIHAHNVSPKQTGGTFWAAFDVAEIKRILGDDWPFYSRESDVRERAHLEDEGAREVGAGGDVQRPPVRDDRPKALVSAAFGVGDLLRVTPLVRALSLMNYQVDVLVAPDYAEAAALLEGAPEIRRLFVYDNFRLDRGARPPQGLEAESYAVAAFTLWAAPLKRWVRAEKTFEFGRAEWLREGDIRCVEKIARALGWQGPLPPPFAVASARRFDLPPGTVALHPGCKPDWQWKKWHGFAELAAMFESVVVVGTEADLQNEQTYFREPFAWPAYARNFVGRLSLADAAALVGECAALVSNDSGLMHLGVALGVPVFGVFGITDPRREMIPAANMFPVTKGLACEPACRRGPWGRRDCEHHLACLKTLTPEEVFAHVRRRAPAVRARSTGAHVRAHETHAPSDESHKSFDEPRAPVDEARAPTGVTRAGPDEVKDMDEISVIYYGYVFDASGYGQAARAYIHALDRAGVALSVVDMARHARQVRDQLVESLVGRFSAADFHLFHGIPPQWAGQAFRLRNAIGMTVWETDVMPSQWRNVLNHVLEVWLPCDYNVSVFGASLEKPVTKLPHAILPPHVNGDAVAPDPFLRTRPGEFVFYSIFEWQERKFPEGMLEAYMRAFPRDEGTVLVIKANPGAAHVAPATVERVRQATGSGARVELRCEAWNDAQLDALHARGDCYVSLHRGEGWGYPLFEAARRGTPVVATAYSGPLEYLSPDAHALVRCGLSPVRQPYLYYHHAMRWAEPDVNHAAELMRAVHQNRDAAREAARRAAARLERDYSLEAVGLQAREKLLRLLRRTQPDKWARLDRQARARRFAPAAPIPGDWYDEHYFEHGAKSNWAHGYTWQQFGDLFRETARFLAHVFPEAESFLDAGCAKGFLVRALRETGKDCWGFDASPWAVAHAEGEVGQYVSCAGTDDVTFDRRFDLLLAFSLFETLTEDQLVSFLSRARAWTRQALFAVIPTVPDGGDASSAFRGDRDLSHITMKPRGWWHETFTRAGWRQDALHRVAERACQRHELPHRMGWQVYIYAPA
jgi:ADP-heptose:LPS heptosyltransferase/glycosyltransferase involved in cell wall biosynthesis/SAM-dependent methyltransferase